MEHTQNEIRRFYDSNPAGEWERIAGRPEFLLTTRILSRYLKPGMKILDLGGGPGRYAIHFAKLGCDMTLADLSAENVKFAEQMAQENGVTIRAMQADALTADETIDGKFDAVLLMGPLYHLLEEESRIRAMEASLNLLKPDGIFAASFITMFAPIIDYMKRYPEMIVSGNPYDEIYLKNLLADGDYAGPAFTQAYAVQVSKIEPFMAQFPLKKLLMFSQEGILSPNEDKIMAGTPDVVEEWLKIAEFFAVKPEYYSWAEHMMYIGRKLQTQKEGQSC